MDSERDAGSVGASSTKSERWSRIDRIFQEAIELNLDARGSFLDEACGSDADLRKEVESLLVCADKPFDFLESAVHEAAQEIVSTKPTGMAHGTLLDHYEIDSLIGGGGMGEVYLAQDIRLKRKVAIKVLAASWTRDEAAMRRFEHEAQTVSSLNHPNILTIFEFCEVDGLHFLAAEFIEGSTLRTMLKRGRLELKNAVDIAIQVASALAAAHASGIVHRDIKPENVMVRSDRLVKVLDFGIAKLVEPLQTPALPQLDFTNQVDTQPGTVVGTFKYMSPEQARGTAVDARSDIFSFGALFYEMIAGRPAFEGETLSDLVAEILKGDPAPIQEVNPKIPPELARIVERALQKNREGRFQSADDLLRELNAFKRHSDLGVLLEKYEAAPRARIGHPVKSLYGKLLVALIAIALIVGGYALLRGRRNAVSPAAHRTLAVLPFQNLRRDDQVSNFLEFSLADAITTKLGYLMAFTVRPSSEVERYRDNESDLASIARQLNVNTLLTGTFIRDGDVLRINAQLIDVGGNDVMWQDSLDVKADKLLAVQDMVTQSIVKGLQMRLSVAEAQRIKPEPPINTLAYEYYLRGVDLYSLGDYPMSIEILKRSAAIAPNYAPTWAQLGRAYTTNASLRFGGRDQYRNAQDDYKRAIALNPELVEPRIYMANLLTDTGHVEDAVPMLKAALKRSPNNAEAHWELGYAYRFAGMLADSVRECERARQLDPDVKITSSAFNSYLYEGEYEKFLRTLPADNSVFILFYYGFGKYYEHKDGEAVVAFDRAYDLAPSLLPAQIGKAFSYAIRHDTADGIRLLGNTERTIDQRGVSDAEGIYKVAQAYAALGDKPAALRMLERSIKGGFFCYPYLASDPLMRSLHGYRTFGALLLQARERHDRFVRRFGSDRS